MPTITAALLRGAETRGHRRAQAPAPETEARNPGWPLVSGASDHCAPLRRMLVENSRCQTDHPKAPPGTAKSSRGLPSVAVTWGSMWVATPAAMPREILLRPLWSEISTLDGSLAQSSVRRPRGSTANFLGMTRETADLDCAAWRTVNVNCFMIGQAPKLGLLRSSPATSARIL